MTEIDYWLDEYNLLHVKPNERSENGVLYIAEFNEAYRQVNGSNYLTDSELIGIITSHFAASHWKQSPWDNRKISHDNMTALYILANALNVGSSAISLRKLLPFKEILRFYHPRDISFYLLMENNVLGYLFLPFLSLAMIISCLRTWKTRPDVFEKLSILFKTGKWVPDHFKAPHTDGKLLTWLRCSTGKFPITWFICRKILQYKYGKTWLFGLTVLYFKHPKHPMRLITYGLHF